MIEVAIRLPGGETGVENYYLEIIRVAGSRNEDSLNRYEARLGGRTAKFDHRYGDGWGHCIERALAALRRAGK